MSTTKMRSTPHGTKEWAKHSLNIQNGCEHGCHYCYAKCMAIRFKRSTAETWRTPTLRPASLRQPHGKKTGRTMFPTSHDITEINVSDCLVVLKKILSSHNEVLIVSKPRVTVVERLINELVEFRNQITFRFSIGSASDQVLRFWEPGAPCFNQRVQSLRLAFDFGFQTGVSCEPMLDQDIDRVIEAVRPFVTDSIWLGKANRLRSIIPLNCPNDPKVRAGAEQVIAWQSDDAIMDLYSRFQNDPIIKWKDSIKKVVGIDQPTESGLDI